MGVLEGKVRKRESLLFVFCLLVLRFAFRFPFVFSQDVMAFNSFACLCYVLHWYAMAGYTLICLSFLACVLSVPSVGISLESLLSCMREHGNILVCFRALAKGCWVIRHHIS